MLHELLLALSGHPSPLLSTPTDKPNSGLFQDLLSPAEAALLKTLACNLGEKHKNIREHSTTISDVHPSMVCRAVATAIRSTHLAAFQQKILEVERQILEENSSFVGAYNIVPLSGLVGAFDGWGRKLEWMWNLVQFMQPIAIDGLKHGEVNQHLRSTSQILDHLRGSTYTGYPDIEQISLNLTKAAEVAWLKQMSAWVLYGRLPILGTSDIFVSRGSGSGGDESTAVYSINLALVPDFVTKSTASSILFIGKSLNHIRENRSGNSNGSAARSSPELELLPSHLTHLSSLEYPINQSSFSAAISAIRLSLSKNALQKLLPISKVLEVLRVLKDFFLLERGEFAVALISAADERLASRHNRSIGRFKQKGSEDLDNVMIKDGEVAAVLAKTWTTLLLLQGADDEDADDLDLARELLRLSIKSQNSNRSISGSQTDSKLSDTTFDDFLLSTPITLKLRIPSPLDLLLSSSSVNVYSQINAYLIAIRRGHLSLSQLFLLSPLRRDHPSPKVASYSHKDRFENLSRMRQRADRRAKIMRPIWAAIGSATFLLTELGEYFQGQVIKSSWNTFFAWLDPYSHDSHSSIPYRPSSSNSTKNPNPTPTPASPPSISHDPETLSLAHTTYLSSLTHALLLTHPPFTKSLRAFLLSTTHLAALTHRLAAVQQALDLEINGIVPVDPIANFKTEEDQLILQLADAKISVERGVTGLVDVLRKVDSERAGGGGWRDEGREDEDETGFVPWGRGVGVERLLLKIDWANGLGLGF